MGELDYLHYIENESLLEAGVPYKKNLDENFMNVSPHKQKLSVLIVEDDFAMQPIWESVLREVSPQVSIKWSKSEEGAEILMNQKITQDQDFDLVIADIYLSGFKTGIDLWEKYLFSDSLFLFTSSMWIKEFANVIKKYENDYVPFFMKKPIKKAVAVETIKAMLSFKKFLIYKSH